MSQTSSYAQAMKREDLFCASSIYGSRGRAKESERKLSKPCYEQDFSWSLRFQFIYGRGETIRCDKRCFSIDFYFFRSHFAEGVIAKYFHLPVFFYVRVQLKNPDSDRILQKANTQREAALIHCSSLSLSLPINPTHIHTSYRASPWSPEAE